jgi:hypothetical protein
MKPSYLSILMTFVIILSACNKKEDSDQGNGIKATTVLTSSSLTKNGLYNHGVLDSVPIYPTNINGQALSLLFATASEQDEGLVFFGDGRPDIAPGNATFYPFDFANQLAVLSNINLKPNYVGGLVQHAVSMFGYIDIYMIIDGSNRVIRLALGEYSVGTDTYIRGDVLLQDMATGEFRFYDLTNSVFTAARPANPYVIEEIRDFTDPIRPNMVYYPLNIFLNPSISFDATELQTATSVYVRIDFFVENFVVLQDMSTTTGISDSALINSFDISQNIVGFGNSGLEATVDSLSIN